MTPFELLLSKLPDSKRSGSGWQARCPAHDDRRPSLSIAEGDDGRALVKCHAGCETRAVVEALGLKLSDLMPKGSAESQETLSRPAKDRRPDKSFSTAREALAALEGGLGEPSASWTYRDTKSEAVGCVIRWDTPKGKEIRPISRTEDGRWIIGGMPEPRPLYSLPDLRKTPVASRVYVTEGEKAADAVRDLGLIATTSAHGSKSASKTDWSPLMKHELVILPDADDAGDRYAEDVADLLGKLRPSPTVKIVRLPDLAQGEGGDMVDFVAMRGEDRKAIRAELEQLADNAVPLGNELADSQTKLTKPMQSRVESFQPFPIEALPKTVAGFVRDAAEAIGCDPSFIALPLLVGFASAIGNSQRIQLKRGWTEPSILWGAIIGESGSTKSPALELALRAVRQKQDRMMKDHREASEQSQRDLEIFEAEKTAWKRNAEKHPDTAGDPPTAPEPPTCERWWTDDATIEALAKLLQDNPRGLLVMRDELAGWLNFGRYSNNGKGGEAAKWLEMFGGRALIVDRKTSATIHVPQATVSIIGGIQPGILARHVGQEHRESGLLARLLLAMPPRLSKVWTEADIDPKAEASIAAIFERLHALPPALNADGEPMPAILTLSRDAKEAWVAFYDEHNAEAANLSGDLAAAWSKLEGYTARLALVHHLIRQSSGEEVVETIDAVSVQAGVTLSRWFANEARRVYAVLAEDGEARERRHAIELIERKGGSVTVREWQRARSCRTADDAEAELAELVDAGLGEWKQPAPGPKGGRPSRRFVLINANKPAPLDDGDNDEWGEL
jgi:hypothetical protein